MSPRLGLGGSFHAGVICASPILDLWPRRLGTPGRQMWRCGMRIKGSVGRQSVRHAVAAVELAVLLPVLTTIVLGCVDFGRFAYNYIAVTNAARAGAAY